MSRDNAERRLTAANHSTDAAESPLVVNLTALAGDGIGPELVRSALTVMESACAIEGVELVLSEERGGAALYQETGAALLPGALDRLRRADGVLKGPVGLPEVRKPDGTEAGLLGGLLRIGLDTFANVRPIRLHAAVDQMLITRAGTERIARFAFEKATHRTGAPRDGVRRVTCVDKSNVLRSFALFREVFDEVAAEYPHIEADHIYADAAAHALVVEPDRFDVLVMENFLGDILSDLGAGTVGGLGMCPSGNIGIDAAYFEPIHGTAPTIAGRNLANPISQILSGAMLLQHCGQEGSARLITTAVERAFADGSIRVLPSGGPANGTEAVTEAVVERLTD